MLAKRLTQNRWFLTFQTVLLLAGCTPGTQKPERFRPFELTVQEVRSIQFEVHVPEKEQNWTLALERKAGGNFPGAWVISNPSYLDRLGNTSFIDHLLDTLTTLQVEGKAPEASSATQRLSPPLYSLKWTQGERTHSLFVGGEIADGGVFAKIDEDKTIYRIQGAALGMLGYLKSLQTLREIKVLPWELDRIQEAELLGAKGRRLFYAQRMGGDWGDSKEKVITSKVQPLLEGLIHLRIQRFVDDDTEAKELQKQYLNSRTVHWVFKDRFDQKIRLSVFALSPTRLIAWVDQRPGAAFELFPEAKHFFTVK